MKIKKQYRIYTSKQTLHKHFDLLLLSSSKKLHYGLIKYFDRVMTNKTKHHGKNTFADSSYNTSLAQKH